MPAPDGDKLSKQNGAAPLDTGDPLATLNAAARVLALPPRQAPVGDALNAWVARWRDSYNRASD